MQIKGEEFIKKVQLQQEREELERKLSELEEVQVSISNSQYNNQYNNVNNNANTINNSVYEQREPQVEVNEHELDNIMLGSTSVSNDDNKKKYLILGIVLVVLFLLTIIIIRLLTNDPKENDQFTSNANSSEIKKLSENNNIEANFQKIINERVKKDSNEPMVPDSAVTAEQRLKAMQEMNNSQQPEERETIQEEAPANISNETVDQTIKKIEEKRSAQKTTEPTEKRETVTKETEKKSTETKKSVKDIVDTQPVVSGSYFVQIGAFTKKPSDSYVNTIRTQGFKYKVLQVEVKGTMYNKVLIGPYSSRAAALEDVDDIKDKLKVTNTFIVKF